MNQIFKKEQVMIINNASFVTSVANKENIIKDALNQVAFVGRSNVGKSSLINMLTNQKKLAKASSTPGRTRLINYFLINNKFYFVDLPGYGFAQASKKEVYSWQSIIEPYLMNNDKLKLVCMLVDARITPTIQDRQMFEYLAYYNLPFIIVATKSDKLSKAQLNKAKLNIANTLGVGLDNITTVSNETRDGKDKLLSIIEKYL